MSAGKGSKPRKVNKKKYDLNYDSIFRKKETTEKEQNKDEKSN